MKYLILIFILSGCASFDSKNWQGSGDVVASASGCEMEAEKHGEGQINKSNIFSACMRSKGYTKKR